MIVDEINVPNLAIFKAEGDAPIGSNRYGPEPLHLTLERVQAQRKHIHALYTARGIQNAEDQPDSRQVLRGSPAGIVAFVEPLQSAMSEGPDHRLLVACGATSVR